MGQLKMVTYIMPTNNILHAILFYRKILFFHFFVLNEDTKHFLTYRYRCKWWMTSGDGASCSQKVCSNFYNWSLRHYYRTDQCKTSFCFVLYVFIPGSANIPCFVKVILRLHDSKFFRVFSFWSIRGNHLVII